jgi:hypothetical protein
VGEHGLSEAPFYTWQSTYPGPNVAALTRLKHPEEVTRPPNQLVTDLRLANQARTELLPKRKQPGKPIQKAYIERFNDFFLRIATSL